MRIHEYVSDLERIRDNTHRIRSNGGWRGGLYDPRRDTKGSTQNVEEAFVNLVFHRTYG